MLIANKYKVPDKCPQDCRFIKDVLKFGQNAMCVRCPVLNCKDSALLRPEEYREDWAKEWERFFNGEVEWPILYLCPPGKD